VALVQRHDAFAGAREDGGVFRQFRRARIAIVAEDREMNGGIEVCEREHLDMLEHRIDGLLAGEQRRHDDHRAELVRHVVGEVEAQQPPRRPSTRPAAGRSATARSLAGMSRRASAVMSVHRDPPTDRV
jgi:hypothetical protein